MLSVLFSYMEDWRWRMDTLAGLGIEKADGFERVLLKPRTAPAASAPVARTAYDERRARILAAGGEIGD